MEKKEIIKEIIEKNAGKDITITVLEGLAQKFLEPVKPIEKRPMDITGTIGIVSDFLSKREVNNLKSHIVVDKQSKMIALFINEKQENNEYTDIIYSFLLPNKQLSDFGINSGKFFQPKEFAKFIRQRKMFFESIDEFQKVFIAFSTFKGQLNKEFENSDDRQGNRNVVNKQAVNHNLPESFTLAMSLFDNTAKYRFKVEIDIDTDTLSVGLISSDLYELEDQIWNDIVKTELDMPYKSSTIAESFFIVRK